MKVTWNWLGDWVELPETPEALMEILAMRGFPVQSLERGTSFDPGIVVGHVLEAGRHPNADRLSLCAVDIGTAKLSIVCGAPNVAAGQRVAVAQVGSKLPDGTKLRKSKIRGVESEGMICSERELGLSEESQGIWVLRGEPAIGTPLAEIVGSSDAVLDIEVTSNRTDCDAVMGLAREIASARRVSLRARPTLRADAQGALPRVEIESPHDCPRYMARVVRDVKIGPSPSWLKQRLEATGFRSINNVVDATNYILREYGQPIHAFDGEKVGGQTIRVRRAKPGERLVLLDGREVALTPSHLVIADAKVPMALAGVMGGLASGVTEATKQVVLESAQFDAVLTRETARELRIDSDAAARFAQGVDPEGVAAALDATARLLAEIAGGSVVKDRVDEWPGRSAPRIVPLAHRRLETLLGISVPTSSVDEALRSLAIERESPWQPVDGDQAATYRIPFHRKDLEIEEDLIEEVGRVIGYDAIPTRLRTLAAPDIRGDEGHFLRRMIDAACGLGFDEALNTVLVGEIPADVRADIEDAEIWELSNPMSRELKHLRVSLLPGLLESSARNLHHGAREVRLVEGGKIFRATPPPIGSERMEIALVLAGQPDEWDRPAPEADRFLELKGVVETLLTGLGIDSIRADTYHHPCWKAGTGAVMEASGHRLGHLGQIAPSLAATLGLERPAWGALLDVAAVARKAPRERSYRSIPRYPVSKRDLAVAVSRETHHAAIAETIRSSGGPLLVRARLFDVFEGASIGPGKKSMAYALEFQAPDRTLADHEVDRIVDGIVRGLEMEFGAVLRGATVSSLSGENKS
jgi:phenylalanyl-tRNA synthetase beta chain